MRAMQPGVVAVSATGGGALGEVTGALDSLGVRDAHVCSDSGVTVVTWGGLAPEADGSLALSRGPRRHEEDLTDAEVSRLLGGADVAGLARVLAPFAAFRQTGADQALAVTDALGFRHLYRTQGEGTAAVSTSARLLAVLGGHRVDTEAVTFQSLLGWQVGQSTLFEGVVKTEPGEVTRLSGGTVESLVPTPVAEGGLSLNDGVRRAAEMLREHLTAYVTQHPDAVLQLTGGQDSRILLSAIPPELRPRVRAMTLSVPGSPDAEIAARLAAVSGMEHQVEALEDLALLPAEEAYALCADASTRLEGMADPLAQAALGVAEQRFDQGHRISGLGGEVARGFYYFGSPRDPAVTRARVARLTDWRMFANESADPAALTPDLREGARDLAVDRIHALFAASGREWLEATDDFYLRQRMQRWAGVTDTAVCFDRSVVNPMLDDRFIAVARGMAPGSKRNSLFLARLQMTLDPHLGDVPLDGRPPPSAYATPGLLNKARAVATLGRKAVAKARQRVGGATLPPVGGAVLAGKVVEQWRREPALLDPALALGVLDESWVAGVLAGRTDPAASTVAFVLNLACLPPASRGRHAG